MMTASEMDESSSTTAPEQPETADVPSECEDKLDSKIPFSDVCRVFERISTCEGKEKRKRLLGLLLSTWRSQHEKMYGSSSEAGKKDSFYPVMRLCLPHLDRKRAAYGMKETVLAKYYIEVLGIARTGADAQKLLNYRAPASGKTQAGDFAAVAYFVLKDRCPETGSLMVTDVNRLLSKIAVCNAAHDRSGVKQTIQQMLRSTSAVEQKWMIRIIMKELKLGINENSILSLFHPDAVDLFSVCADLDKVCVDLADPSFRLNEAAIQLFTPFRPMLGQRASIPQAFKLAEGRPFYVETKFDGDRMQLHRDGSDYRYFSRSSKDYTASFGARPESGSLTAQIHSALSAHVSSCILDGEMVGYDLAEDCFVPKGDNIDVKAISGASSRYEGMRQCFVVFDVLMVNGRNLANLSLRERARELEQVFTPVKGVLHLVDRKELSHRDELVACLNEAIDKREEGLLVKLPDSTYQPDKRKGSGWLKLKPEYLDSLSDQLDLLILGGYYGSGRRGGIVSHFLLGIAETPQPGQNPSKFYSFCKVGTGYTISELRSLTEELAAYWRPFSAGNIPPNVVLTAANKERPDVVIAPEFSRVVQIRAAEVTPSDKYSCDCTLRFPRLERFREDKDWHQCMRMDELENIKQSSAGRLAHSCADGFEDISVKKRRLTGGRKVAVTRGVASQFRSANLDEVEVTSDTFRGKEFYVVNGSPALPKNDVELKIASYGGVFRQNPTPNTLCVLAHKHNLKVKHIVDSARHNVVKLDWFLKCVAEERFIPLTPEFMIYTEPSTQRQFQSQYDEYGDSYTGECSSEEFLSLCRRIREGHNSPDGAMSHTEIAEIKDKYIEDVGMAGVFRYYTFYIDRYSAISNIGTAIALSPLELTEISIRLHGGGVSDKLVEGVSHVIMSEADLSRLGEIRSSVKSFHRLSYVVTSQWVRDCIELQHPRSEKLYEPRI